MTLFRTRRILSITALGMIGVLGACNPDGEIFTSVPQNNPAVGAGGGSNVQTGIDPSEICTGTPPSSPWSHAFPGNQQTGASAIDAAGNTIFAGTLFKTIDIAGTMLATSSLANGYVTKLDPSGNVLWAEKIGADTCDIELTDVGLDDSGNVYVTGTFRGSFSFAGSTLGGNAQWNTFIARLDPDGHAVWGKSFGTLALPYVNAFTVMPSGRTTIAGCLQGTTSFGGAPLTGVQSSSTCAMYLASFDENGNHLFSKAFVSSSPSNNDGWRIATDAGGTTVFAATFAGSLDLGGGPLPVVDALHSCLAAFDPAGQLLWSRTSLGVSSVVGVALASSGDILLAGSPEGQAAGTAPLALARLDASGSLINTTAFPQEHSGFGRYFFDTVRVRALGNDAVLAGNFYFGANLGCGTMFSVHPEDDGNGGDIFVARVDPAGKTLLSARFGGKTGQKLHGIAVDAAGDLTMVGRFQDAIDFGSGVLTTPPGGLSAFVARLHL